MLKRLSGTSGEVVENAPRDTDSEDKVTRQAILVHGGEEGAAMVFMSGDGEISFDKARIKAVVKNQNKIISNLAEQYGGIEKMPVGAFPPVLDQHENDSNNRVVGRMTGLLRFEVRDVPKVGKKVPCAIAEVTFLGKDTVDRVKDGRIYHLSIGIDEETNTLGEVSTVITPAAPGAMLLSAAKKKSEGDNKMSEKTKRLEAHTKRMAKLAAISESLESQKKKLVAAQGNVKLTAKKGEISHRLTGLMRSGKLTPAEHKKIDVTKLAAMSQEQLDASFSLLEIREPVIMAGQKGTATAAEFGEIAMDLEKRQMKRLAAEIKGDFKKLGAKLAFDDKVEEKEKEMSGPKEEIVHPGKDEGAVPGEMKPEAQLSKHMEAMKAHLEAGNVEGAKQVHEEMAKHMAAHGAKHLEAGVVGSEEEQKSMEAMQAQVDELSTQLARVAGMVQELMVVEKEEGHELAAEPGKGEEDEKIEDHAPTVEKKSLEHDKEKEEMKKELGLEDSSKHVPPAMGAGEHK